MHSIGCLETGQFDYHCRHSLSTSAARTCNTKARFYQHLVGFPWNHSFDESHLGWSRWKRPNLKRFGRRMKRRVEFAPFIQLFLSFSICKLPIPTLIPMWSLSSTSKLAPTSLSLWRLKDEGYRLNNRYDMGGWLWTSSTFVRNFQEVVSASKAHWLSESQSQRECLVQMQLIDLFRNSLQLSRRCWICTASSESFHFGVILLKDVKAVALHGYFGVLRSELLL